MGAALCGSLSGSRPREEFPALEGKWRYYQSPHFELYSINTDWESRNALEKLELLRAVFLDTFKLKERQPQPLTIFFFDSARDFRAYLPESLSRNVEYAGLCVAGADRSVIMLSPTGGEDSDPVVNHEFIHYMFRIADANPPRWFNEGVAELYSTVKDEHDAIDVGLPSEGRTFELHGATMIPLDRLFALNDSSEVFKNDHHTGVFYAESWALLHYFEFGTTHLPEENVHKFLQLASSELVVRHPVALQQACRDLLGCDYAQLQDRLGKYIVSGSFHWKRYPRPPIADPKTYTRREAPRAEMVDRLAELSLRTNRAPFAKLALLKAVDAEPDNARLLEVLGNDALAEGNDAETRERWEKAIALGTTNTAIFQKVAALESQRWFHSFDLYFRLPDARAEQLRGLLLQSLKLAPDQNDAYEMLAWVESAARQINVANVNQVQKRFPLLKHQARTLVALAQIRTRMNDLKSARTQVELIQKLDPDAATRAGALALLAEINRRETAAAEAPDEPEAKPTTAPPDEK